MWFDMDVDVVVYVYVQRANHVQKARFAKTRRHGVPHEKALFSRAMIFLRPWNSSCGDAGGPAYDSWPLMTPLTPEAYFEKILEQINIQRQQGQVHVLKI